MTEIGTCFVRRRGYYYATFRHTSFIYLNDKFNSLTNKVLIVAENNRSAHQFLVIPSNSRYNYPRGVIKIKR